MMEINRLKTICYNAITLGQLEELYDKESLLAELGCTEKEYMEIMGDCTIYEKDVIVNDKGEGEKFIKDYFDEHHDTYDTYDNIYDVCITVTDIEENVNNDYYDKFCILIYKNVKVIRKENSAHLYCKWTEFFDKYKKFFEKITEKYWRFKPAEEDDLTETWLREINGLLAGYASEDVYKDLYEGLFEEICYAV